MTPEEVRARWRTWAEREIGGPPARIDAAADAAAAASTRGLDQAAVISAARQAAQRHEITELRLRWRTWAERVIGGSPQRIDAATDAAVAAATRGLGTAAAEAAARQAAQPFGGSADEQRSPSRPVDPRPDVGHRRGLGAAAGGGPGSGAGSATAGSAPGIQLSDSRHLRGQVTAFEHTQKPVYQTRGGRRSTRRVKVGSYPSLRFGVRRFDGQGGQLPVVPVEMKGKKITGRLSNGDWVEIETPKRWSEGNTLRPRKLRNLSAQQTVEIKGSRNPNHPVISTVMLLIIVVAGIFLVHHFAQQGNNLVRNGNGGNNSGLGGNNGNGGGITSVGTGCSPGYVPRIAYPGDPVCVTPAEEAQVTSDNAQAASRVQPGGGAFGPDTCISGYVWREARPSDHVCVIPAVRAQTAAENQNPNNSG